MLAPWLGVLGDTQLHLPDHASAHAGLVQLVGVYTAAAPPADTPRDGGGKNGGGSARGSSSSSASSSKRSKAGSPALEAGTLKQVVVTRSPPLVLIFDVISWGRAWYRTLVFTSDASRSLHEPMLHAGDDGASDALHRRAEHRARARDIDPHKVVRMARRVELRPR